MDIILADTYLKMMRETKAHLKKIKAGHDARMEYNLSHLNWGHVAELERINDLLAEVVELSK